MNVVAFDLSTTKVGVARLTLEGEYIDSTTWRSETGITPVERVHDWSQDCPRGTFYDNIAQVVIEQPMGVGPDVLTWLGAMVGATVAHIPWSTDLIVVKPLEWRQWLGWPRLKRADAKRQAITWAEAKTGRLLPEDEAEAVCMALAVLRKLEEAVEQEAA